MIQIDDAGNGAVLGGEVIGALRLETSEYAYRVLPLRAYTRFEIHRTMAARDAVLDLLQELKHQPEEDLFLCTGDVFKEAKETLTVRNVLWQEQKITGNLQELVEASFFNSLLRYGLPEKFRAFYQDYQKFHNKVLRWVCQDLEHRSKYCKPLRLNSSLVARAKIYRTLVQKTQNCAACQQPILPFSLGIVDKTEETPAYFHLYCFPSTVPLADYQEEIIDGEVARSFLNRFPTTLVCATCQQPIKYKKRSIIYAGDVHHFACFAPRLKDNSDF